MRTKHVPTRTCLGTGEKFPKKELIRIVCIADGRIMVDETGKLAGSRGAYVSRSLAALRSALTRRRLEAEFERPIADADREALLEYFSSFG
ncbi:MAG: YlxR family protein [Chloroflexi bacterium]|nr:YlxR family protein [Chloroflexota bacterium]